jgi:cyanate lyase
VVRRSRFASPFGASVSVALAEARMTQTELAAKTGRSTAYVNQLITGHKKPSPEWVELIADTLKLAPEQRRALHEAAARQHGFKLDLRKK